jgi:hypothetical protein
MVIFLVAVFAHAFWNPGVSCGRDIGSVEIALTQHNIPKF